MTPGIVAVFFAGVVSKRIPAFAARAGLLAGIPIYAALRLAWPETAFLHHMGISFLILVAGLAFAAWRWPRTEAPAPPTPVTGVDLTPLPGVYWKGGLAPGDDRCDLPDFPLRSGFRSRGRKTRQGESASRVSPVPVGSPGSRTTLPR